MSKLGFVCYLLVAVSTTSTGLMYLLRDRLMPYHLDALGTAWEQLPAEQQLMFGALINGAGAGTTAAGVAMLLMLFFPYRRGETWAAWALFLVGGLVTAPTALIILRVQANSAGRPPLAPVLAGLVLLVLGLGLSLLAAKKRSNREDGHGDETARDA